MFKDDEREEYDLAAPDELLKNVKEGQVIVDVAKGIEPDTLFTLTQVIGDEIKKDGKHNNIKLVALSGPTHAEEVSVDLPTTIVAASEDPETAKYVQSVFMNDVMRVYTNSDVLGVETCGALKNIIALASGIALGLGYGDNTKAALITRGMHEIAQLGKAMGCDERTFYGLAGIGDLIVTATSVHSRNNRCGHLIGERNRDAVGRCCGRDRQSRSGTEEDCQRVDDEGTALRI